MRRMLLVTGSMLFVGVGAGMAEAAPPLAPGSQIAIHPHVGTHAYVAPDHHIRGRVGIDNYSSHAVTLKCNVVVTLEGDGDTRKKGEDTFRARVAGGTKRKPHYAIDIRDADHHLRNVPTHIAAHCRRV